MEKTKPTAVNIHKGTSIAIARTGCGVPVVIEAGNGARINHSKRNKKYFVLLMIRNIIPIRMKGKSHK